MKSAYGDQSNSIIYISDWTSETIKFSVYIKRGLATGENAIDKESQRRTANLRRHSVFISKMEEKFVTKLFRFNFWNGISLIKPSSCRFVKDKSSLEMTSYSATLFFHATVPTFVIAVWKLVKRYFLVPNAMQFTIVIENVRLKHGEITIVRNVSYSSTVGILEFWDRWKEVTYYSTQRWSENSNIS